MSESIKRGFLIWGKKEKREDDVFNGHHLHQIFIWNRATDRLPLLHTDAYRGTIREQLGTDMLARYGDFGTK